MWNLIWQFDEATKLSLIALHTSLDQMTEYFDRCLSYKDWYSHLCTKLDSYGEATAELNPKIFQSAKFNYWEHIV